MRRTPRERRLGGWAGEGEHVNNPSGGEGEDDVEKSRDDLKRVIGELETEIEVKRGHFEAERKSRMSRASETCS